MTGRDRFEQELTTWLRGVEPNEAPDRVLSEALHRTQGQPQARRWLDRLAGASLGSLVLRGAAVAAVVVVAVVIGSQLSGLPPAGEESPSPAPSVSAEPSPLPTPLVACPNPPYTFVTITGVPIEDRATCFGDQEVVLTGWVLRMTEGLPACEPVNGSLVWLYCEQFQQPLAFGTLPPGPYQPEDRLLWVAADPAGPLGPIVLGGETGQSVRTNTWVEVTGHFNDPSAQGCDAGAGGGGPPYAKCVGAFVISAVTEIVAPWPQEALVSSECVTQPLDLLTLIFQSDPAACYGSAPITVEAEVRHPGVIDGPCLFTEPAWLGCSSWVELVYVRPPTASGPVVLASAHSHRSGWFAQNVPTGGFQVSLLAAIHPDAGILREELVFGATMGQVIRVTGHFDDPAALTCLLGAGAPPGFATSAEEMVRSCRSLFVVTGVAQLE